MQNSCRFEGPFWPAGPRAVGGGQGTGHRGGRVIRSTWVACRDKEGNGGWGRGSQDWVGRVVWMSGGVWGGTWGVIKTRVDLGVPGFGLKTAVNAVGKRPCGCIGPEIESNSVVWFVCREGCVVFGTGGAKCRLLRFRIWISGTQRNPCPGGQVLYPLLQSTANKT